MEYALPDDGSAAQIVIGHTYGGSCRGIVNLYSEDGSVTELFTHGEGETFDPETIEFSYEKGAVLEIQETNTCIIDLYSLSVLKTVTCSQALTPCDEWETLMTFGSDNDICSMDEMEAYGWVLTDTNDDYCQSDYYGPWCGGTCTGYMEYALPDTAGAARLKIGHTYGGSCQGFVNLHDEYGVVTQLFTHGEGETFDPEVIEFEYEKGSVLEVQETNTCIIDLYSLSVLPDNCCPWTTLMEFGSNNDICSTSDMESYGWVLTDISDDYCQDDYYGCWCGGDCTGYMEYALPDDYTMGQLVIGHSYGGSCRGIVNLYDADGSVTELFTHGEGEEFAPEAIEFTYEKGSVIEVQETNTCIIDLYSLSVRTGLC
jgi:hypothetical protein